MNLGHLWHEPDKVLKWVEVLMSGIENGWIRPHVDRSFSLTKYARPTLTWKVVGTLGRLCSSLELLFLRVITARLSLDDNDRDDC